METLEERLRRELQRLSPPGDPTGVVDRVLRKAARRHTRRGAGIALLALSVIAGSIGGFYALSRIFGRADQPIWGSTAATNGRIALSLHSESTTQRIALLDPDGTGLRFLTAGDRVATAPAWSPDGSQLVFLRVGEDKPHGLWIMDADGTHARPLYETAASIWAIEWSPDGSMIAFVNVVLPQGPATELDFSDDLYTVDAEGKDATPIITDGQVTDFDWSPDGTRLVIERQYPLGDDRLGYDLAIVDADGGREQPLTSDGVSRDPTWSPDGSSIVHVGSATGDFRNPDLFAIAPDGTGRMQLTNDEATEEDPVFSPDGSLVAYTRFPHGDGSACELVLMEPDGASARAIATKDTLGGCPVALSWQPLPATDIPVEPSTTPSPTPEDGDDGEDIGLGFPVCFSERLGGIDHIGDGSNGAAWTAVPAKDDGTCPRYPAPDEYLLAVDHTGDRVADSWIDLPFECANWCPPFDATDLDGNGTEELIVVNSFSIMGYSFFGVRPNADGDLQVEPIMAAVPGHERAGISAGEPLQIDAGGDAGYSSAIECEGYPSEPVIVWSWSFAEIDSDEPTEVHVTRIELRPDGLFHVIATNDFTVPAREPTGVANAYELGPECGVDWYR